MSFESIWAVPEAGLAEGRFPGYVAAVRVGGHAEIHAAGRIAVDAGSAPMQADTQFRIASVTKPMGGALTLSLVEDGLIALDDEVAPWAPELAAPSVLVDPDGPLDRVVPAVRPVTIRHLLTLTSGWGVVIERTPLTQAMADRGVHAGPMGLALSGDEFLRGVGSIPLAFQPGEGWRYDTGIDLLGVVLERALGRSLGDLLHERIFQPLGMRDTAFHGSADRLAALYEATDDGLALADPPDGKFSRPPGFPQLSGGLVSTAGDVLRFYSAMADGELLSDASRAALTSNALTPQQRAAAPEPFLVPGSTWGLGTGVVEATGAWGWTGGTGTSAAVDPSRDTVAVILTQRQMAGPADSPQPFHDAVAEVADADRSA
jgi:CubicO group peptidase (beta-lactamase class C family)